jgi:hypothetical protein
MGEVFDEGEKKKLRFRSFASKRSCEDCPLWGAFILNKIEEEATRKVASGFL